MKGILHFYNTQKPISIELMKCFLHFYNTQKLDNNLRMKDILHYYSTQNAFAICKWKVFRIFTASKNVSTISGCFAAWAERPVDVWDAYPQGEAHSRGSPVARYIRTKSIRNLVKINFVCLSMRTLCTFRLSYVKTHTHSCTFSHSRTCTHAHNHNRIPILRDMILRLVRLGNKGEGEYGR